MEEDLQIADKLSQEKYIGEDSLQKIKTFYSSRLFSIGYELRTLLSAGILLLSTGLGILIYNNIDSIGHMAIILFIAAISITCIGFCYVKRLPYSPEKVDSPTVFYDYILLFGCLSFVSFSGYLQYQYSVFGSYNEVSMLIPAILFFALAYYLDHIGALSLGITCFAAFIGISVTPVELLRRNDFQSWHIITSGLILGALLIVTAILLARRNIKRHFKFTYLNFAIHLLFVSCLSGLAVLNIWPVFIIPFAACIYVGYREAIRDKSFYFLFFTVLYGYIGSWIVFVKIVGQIAKLTTSSYELWAYSILGYGIGSSALSVSILTKKYKELKQGAYI